MAAERKEDFNKQWFISATMVSGLRRSFILQLCIFRLCCHFEENSLHFGEVSAPSFRIKPWLKLPKCSDFFFKIAKKAENTKLKDKTSS